jgi:hypothetical protein
VNHKVVSVELVGSEDVYDFEVEVYHNFALGGAIPNKGSDGTEKAFGWIFGSNSDPLFG